MAKNITNPPLQPVQQSTNLLEEIGSEVSRENAPLLEFITQHGGKIAGFVAIFLLVAAITGVWKWYKQKDETQFLDEKTKIELTLEGQERISALKALQAKAPDRLKTILSLTVGEYASELKDYAAAEKAYSEAALNDADGNIAPLAQLAQASCLLRQDKNAEALKLLQDLEKRLPTPTPMHYRQMLADAALRSGNETLAKDTLTAMIKESDPDEAAYFERVLAQISSPQEDSSTKNTKSTTDTPK
ncbi:MAG: tetratricopeptide repeat protein [Desulfovibrionaceae bacterium]|nr:tetratricopeptide repeat protein [Desulfovibrionaceae bacterium]